MKKQIKRHFYNGVHYVINKENKMVELLPEFHTTLINKKLWGRFGFKKIGGSSIGDVLEVDKFKSKFSAFCRLSWIGMPILDRKYVDAGIAIEPLVIKAIEKATKKKVETFDPLEYNFDYFAGQDDILGGLPDGFISETKTVLELKTTGEKNLVNWKKWGIPAAYLRQAQLYAYLMKVEKYSIVATFLKEEDYSNPKNYPIKDRKILNWNYEVNIEQVEDDIKKVKDWYNDVTSSGVSPKYDEVKDSDLLLWLEPKNENEWLVLKEKWISEGKIVE